VVELVTDRHRSRCLGVELDLHGTGTAVVEDLDAKESRLLGNTVGGRADGTSTVSAVTVVIGGGG
jgi:hypothetical protein